MRIIEQLVYKITGDNTGFDKSIDKSEGKVTKFGSVADKIFAGVTVAAIGMVIKKTIEMGNELVDAASEAQETANKFGVTFRDIREEADATAKNLSDNFGLSSQKAQQLLSDTGDLLTGFGFTQESALDLSTQVNELAVDLASFTNYSGGAEGASAALTKALLGERESIKSLGIAITEADITQLAEDKGIVGELTRQEKAMLTLEIAISQSKNAIGDFARSSDEYANQSRILEGNLQDLRVEMGNKLLPIATQIKSAFVELTGNILSNITANTELEKQTRNLTTQSINYKNVISQLEDPMSVLTEAEKTRLGILKEIQAQNLEDTIYQTSRAYKESANAVKQAEIALEELEIKQSAYTLVTNDLASAQERLKELTQTKNRTTQEEVELSNLRTAMMDTEFQRQTEILTLGDRINEQRGIAESLNKSYEVSLRAISEAVADGVVDINQYALTNVAFYDAVMDNVEVIEAERLAVKEATEEFGKYKDALLLTVEGKIAELEASNRTLAGEKLLQMLYEKRQGMLAKIALNTQNLTEKENARNEILANAEEAMASAEQYASALGDSYDLNAQKVSILETTIKSLIDSGLTAEDDAVASLIAQLKTLTPTTEEATEAQEDMAEAVGKNTNIIPDAQKAFNDYKTVIDNLRASLKQAEEFEKLYGDQFDLNAEKATILKDAIDSLIRLGFEASSTAVQELVAQLEELGDTTTKVANTNIIPAAQIAFNTWVTEQQRAADEAERQAERVRQAWESATFSMLSSVTSIWGSINQVQANQNDEEIQRIEEQNAIAIQAAKDRGASEEELTALEKSLQADLNETKNQYAQEEAERQKAVSTLSVITDTARAIMQIWANPLISPWGKGIWTGLAAGAGAAQIAAINSAPVPSYDVGSIRIPDDTQAVVHRNEMILPAPIAEQARQEGVTIAPSGGNTSVPIHLVVELDGRVIGETTVKGINAGQYGRISARVVK